MPVYSKCALAILAGHVASSSALSLDLDEAKDRPTTAVVKMLKGMQQQLEDEKEADEDLYKKLTCWCKTGRKEKAESVKAAQDKIEQLKGTAGELKATVEALTNEMASLKEQVAAAQAAMDQARAIREKSFKKFVKADQDLQRDITAVESALAAISGDSFLQMPKNKANKLSKALAIAMERRANLLEDSLGYADRDMIDAFIKDPTHFDKAAFLQEETAERGEPGTTFKIMRDDFKKERKAITDAEEEEVKDHEELVQAKKEEMRAGEKRREAKRSIKARKKEELFKAQVEVKEKEKAIAADTEFLAMLEKKCGTSDKEWEERTKTRGEEIEAVGKAIEILDGDEAHATFSRALSFVQQSMEAAARSTREKALSVLRNSGSSRLLALAATAQKPSGIQKVTKAIDGMVVALKAEQQDEVEQKDFCVKSFNTNKAAVAAEKDANQDLSAKADQIKARLDTIAGDVSDLKGKVKEAQDAATEATETRKKEAADFVMTVADQKATQKLVNKALGVLRKVYGGGVSMVQGDEGPEGFKPFSKNKKSFGVMSAMQQIIADGKALEAETTRAEEEAKADYEREMAASKKTLDALNSDLSTQSENKAKAKQELLHTEKAFDGSEKELANLAAEEADLHETCDFLLKNFEMRKTARNQEIDSLGQAKAILGGGKVESFMQKKSFRR
eukprot:TRINITY_DN629_c1_g1_i4.p1 TRINITY_DN629_c1_g1~~TRINITY_DN629_c1_g1_i4.p1  ORF type:complete len:678 (-),score=271.35 TRINITY_DN629_c1_g1_i4:114-2147(-)